MIKIRVKRLGLHLTLLLFAACGDASGTGPDGVESNRPPRFGELADRVYHTQEFRHRVSVVDPDGDPVTVTASSIPDWLRFDPDSLTLSGVPGEENIGPHQITLRASDGMLSVDSTFQVTVELSPCVWRAVFGDPAESPYVLPVPPGDTVFVLQPYCGPGSHSRDNQLAYDFRTAFGAPIVAARGGVVLEAEGSWPDDHRVDTPFNYLIIRHPDDSFAFYAHLKHGSLTVGPGYVVTQGQLIAASGESGTPTMCDPGVCGVLHFQAFRRSWVADLPVGFRNAQGVRDARGGLLVGSTYLALPIDP